MLEGDLLEVVEEYTYSTYNDVSAFNANDFATSSKDHPDLLSSLLI